MAGKYIELNNGQLAEKAALSSSAGAADANKIVSTNGEGKLDVTLMPDGIAADVAVLPASEDLSAGQLVNVFDDSGTAKARKADASNGRRAVGFVKAAVTSGQNATVFKEGTMAGSGLTIGSPTYLGTNGAATQTAPSTTGHISQEIGVAISATEIEFEPQQPVTLA